MNQSLLPEYSAERFHLPICILSAAITSCKQFFPLSNDELNSIVDGTMKDTLLNVFIEANSGEFSVDNPLCTITKSKNN